MSDKIRSYAELRELIRVSLRVQNPEWVAPNGDSPVCDSYEARFAELLGLSERRDSKLKGRAGPLVRHGPEPSVVTFNNGTTDR